MKGLSEEKRIIIRKSIIVIVACLAMILVIAYPFIGVIYLIYAFIKWLLGKPILVFKIKK